MLSGSTGAAFRTVPKSIGGLFRVIARIDYFLRRILWSNSLNSEWPRKAQIVSSIEKNGNRCFALSGTSIMGAPLSMRHTKAIHPGFILSSSQVHTKFSLSPTLVSGSGLLQSVWNSLRSPAWLTSLIHWTPWFQLWLGRAKRVGPTFRFCQSSTGLNSSRSPHLNVFLRRPSFGALFD